MWNHDKYKEHLLWLNLYKPLLWSLLDLFFSIWAQTAGMWFPWDNRATLPPWEQNVNWFCRLGRHLPCRVGNGFRDIHASLAKIMWYLDPYREMVFSVSPVQSEDKGTVSDVERKSDRDVFSPGHFGKHQPTSPSFNNLKSHPIATVTPLRSQTVQCDCNKLPPSQHDVTLPGWQTVHMKMSNYSTLGVMSSFKTTMERLQSWQWRTGLYIRAPEGRYFGREGVKKLCNTYHHKLLVTVTLTIKSFPYRIIIGRVVMKMKMIFLPVTWFNILSSRMVWVGEAGIKGKKGKIATGEKQVT